MASSALLAYTVLLTGVSVALASVSVSAQRVELDLRRVTIDHDWDSSVLGRGEAIPPGFGVTARYVWRSGAFLELSASRGSDRRQGVICGGWIIDPASECIFEPVEHSGGLFALSAGRRFQLDLGASWLGIRPKAGLGALWVSEQGRDTGRSFLETPLALFVGVALEGGYRLSGRRL